MPRILPTERMFPGQQAGIGGDERGVVADCRGGDEAVRGIAMQAAKPDRENGDISVDRKLPYAGPRSSSRRSVADVFIASRRFVIRSVISQS